MVPRRNDRELVEDILSYLNEIKLVATEGELASALNINSETANKWLELFLIIKKRCPDFNYKKLGRYRIIDMVDLGGLTHEISRVELRKVTSSRYRMTRYEVLNAIHRDIRKITRMLIHQLRENELENWNEIIENSVKEFNEMIDVKVNLLAGSEGKDDEFQSFKSSLSSFIEEFIKSLKSLEKDEAPSPKLKLDKLQRDFIQKCLFVLQKFEESELKSYKKADYLTLDKKLPKASKSDLLAELKVKLDNMPNVLQKLDNNDFDQRKKTPKLIPILKCFNCNFEQQFPTHCSQSMDYEDGYLICNKCKEKISIPTCSKCNQTLGISVKELVID